MTPTGYAKPGTTIWVDAAPVADVLAIPQFPKMSGPGVVETTTLAATKRTRIPNNVMGLDPFQIKIKNSPTALATFQTLCEGGSMHDVEIRFTDGESFFMTAAKGGNAFFSDIDPGGASGADDTSVDAFTVTVNPSGDWDVSATTGHWYDACTGLSILGGDFGITAVTSPITLVVMALYGNGFAAVAPNSGLDFTSSDAGKATCGAHTGIVTFVAAGDTTLRAAITAAPTIDISCVCTAS